MRIPRGQDIDEFVTAVKNAEYGTNHGSRRHIIELVQRRTSRYGEQVIAQGMCGQTISRVHDVTVNDWNGKKDDLSKLATCKVCLKRAGRPPEPTKQTCPTCQGTGKVQAEVEVPAP